MSLARALAGAALCATLVACGARTDLFAATKGVVAGGGGAPFVDGGGGARFVDGGGGAGPVDASDASIDASDASLDASDAAVDADAGACASEPCLCAPALVPGQSVSGSTCNSVGPPGSSCSDVPVAFYSYTVPPATELPLDLSADLAWGVLCACPEAPGPGCCIGPGGTTGPFGVGTFLANNGSAPLHGVLEVQRADGSCGPYTITLGSPPP